MMPRSQAAPAASAHNDGASSAADRDREAIGDMHADGAVRRVSGSRARPRRVRSTVISARRARTASMTSAAVDLVRDEHAELTPLVAQRRAASRDPPRGESERLTRPRSPSSRVRERDLRAAERDPKCIATARPRRPTRRSRQASCPSSLRESVRASRRSISGTFGDPGSDQVIAADLEAARGEAARRSSASPAPTSAAAGAGERDGLDRRSGVELSTTAPKAGRPAHR